MSKTIEEYLRIIYPNLEQLSEEEKLQFEKDKAFLLECFEGFEDEYNKYIKRKEEFGEQSYTETILKMSKEKYDRETIIKDYVNGMLEVLGENSYITQNYDEFMNLMRVERHQEEAMKEVEMDRTPIEIGKVFELTEEFLSQIDPSGEMIAEFRKLRSEGKIKYLFPDEQEKKSKYNRGEINFAFTGTIESACDLTHEFIHHWIEIKAHPNNNRVEHTMFNEFESIYYENAFIRFMNNKGLLKNGENPLLAERLRWQYDKDPDNCVLMLLSLCQVALNGVDLDKDTITDALRKYMPEGTDREEVWEKCSELLFRFKQDNYFPVEIVNGAVMYRFNTGLAIKTSLDSRTVGSVHKLVPFLQDRLHDDEFMRQYKLMRRDIAEEKNQDVKKREI